MNRKRRICFSDKIGMVHFSKRRVDNDNRGNSPL